MAICNVLAGDPVEFGVGVEREIRKRVKPFAAIPRLCRTAAERDRVAFASTLDEYLTSNWGPLVERRTKITLKEKPCDYSGKWSFLAAALCRIMGGVPDLTPRALRYIPIELVTA